MRVIAAVISIWTQNVLYRDIKIVFQLEKSELSSFSRSVSLLQELLFTEFISLYDATKTNCKSNKYKQHRTAKWNLNAARQRKSTVSTFYVFLVFLLCSLPTHCALVALYISPQSSAFLNGLLLYTETLTFLNCSLKTVIYCWKRRHIRRSMMDTLRNMFSSQT